MEHTRENEVRGGHPGGSSAGDRNRSMPLNGFEGMNYEQHREPYNQSRQQRKTANSNDEHAESYDHNRNDHS